MKFRSYGTSSATSTGLDRLHFALIVSRIASMIPVNGPSLGAARSADTRGAEKTASSYGR